VEKSIRRPLAYAYATIVYLLLGATNLSAECVQQTAKSAMSSHALTFSGTVVEITQTLPFGARVTFEVDWVWKGFVTRRFDLYVSYRETELPQFEIGKRYLAMGDLLRPQLRQDVGLDEKNTVAYAPARCSDWTTTEADLGTGAPPER